MPRTRHGLTLVELLVVLVILAIMTTAAITMTDSMVDQSRYDATVRTLQSIQDAIAGPANQRNADGTILISGFVADTGRLPLSLVELLANPGTLKPFSLYQPASPSTTPVLTPAGWNGPYLNTPFLSSAPFLDGWGNAIVYDPAAGTLTSLGADGKSDASGGDTTGYKKDLVVTLPAVAGTITGQIQILDPMTSSLRSPTAADGTITLSFIGPNTGSDSLANPVKEIQTTITIPSTGNVSYTLAATEGPRIIWVSIGPTGTAKKSPYTRIMVRPTTNVVNLVAQ